MQFWYLRGQEAQAKELFARFPRMLDFFEQEIGPYPFGDEKMGVVETPHLGMEHQTINAYGNNYRLNGYGYDQLLQHEFAHEWFGNQMTNADWDDMWLHEGFGTYMQPLYSQYLHGDTDYYSWLRDLRLMLRNRRPIVSGSSKTEEQVYDESTGPGQDIYNKGAVMLHSLRQLIGDKDFFDSIRLLVYGRADPKPGNFRPRYASTDEYVAIVDKVTGRDLRWFFDVYLRDAALPRLDEQHDGDTLTLRWVTEHGKPFPMPVEVQVGDTLHTLSMTHGEGQLKVPAGSLLIVDPRAKVLRDMPYIDAYQRWMKQQRDQRPSTARNRKIGRTRHKKTGARRRFSFQADRTQGCVVGTTACSALGATAAVLANFPPYGSTSLASFGSFLIMPIASNRMCAVSLSCTSFAFFASFSCFSSLLRLRSFALRPSSRRLASSASEASLPSMALCRARKSDWIASCCLRSVSRAAKFSEIVVLARMALYWASSSSISFHAGDFATRSSCSCSSCGR